MSDFQKGLIAAVVAVRTGRITPETATNLIQNNTDDDALYSAITAASSSDDGTHDPFSGGTVVIAPMNIESILSALKDGADDALPAGLDAKAKDGLLRLHELDSEEAKADVMDTLLALVPSMEAKPAEKAELNPPSQDITVPARSVTTMRPSTRRLENLDSPDRYKIRMEHARGGMGRILVARDNLVGREVALKELLKSTGRSVAPGSAGSEGVEERFLREAKITGQLEHPNIVTVYEIGKNEDGSIYYTMKFVHGVTMTKRLQGIENDLTLSKSEKMAARFRMLDGFADVCNAIAFAHSKGVIHRDLKPDNIMLGEFGETVVLDWGLARVKGQEDEAAKDLAAQSRAISASLLNSDSANLTLDGSIVGTPAYMAPEQARGNLKEIDEQTDVYALGAVLFQLLSGRPPYEGPSAGLIVQQVLAGPPTKLKSIAPDVPPELIALVERSMAQDKSERFASARELASEIQAFRDGRALSSYSYSTAESVKRWVGRHKAAVLTAMLALSVIITGSVFAFVELEKEKSAAVRGQTAAVASQQEAEAATELAESQSKAASEARAEAESAAQKADLAAGRATEAEKTARTEAERSKQLLSKLRHALAEDYAVRVRVSQGRGDYNSAYAYAAACLKTIDHPVARGAIMSDGQVIPRVWQFEPDEVATQDIHEFYALAVSPDSRFVATGMQSGKVVIWNLKTGEKVQTLELKGKQVFAVAFHPCEPVLIAASARDQVVAYRYSDETGSFQLDGKPIGVGSVRVTSLEFSPDGQTIAMGGDRLHLLSWPGFKVLDAPKTGDYMPMVARFSPDGKRMSTTSLLPSLAFGDATIWDLNTGGTQRRTIPSNRWELFSAWSPDSKYIATAGFGGEITIREADKMGSKGVVLRGHTSTVLQVNYSPSGKYLASASADGTVRLWSTHTGRSIAVLSGFPTWVQSVLFNPGETLLLLRDIQGVVSVWDIREFDRNSLRAHTDDVIDIDYSTNGSLLATASIDGRINLISSKTKEVVKTMGVGAEPFLSVAFVPGKQRLLAGNMRGLYVYDYGVPGARLETPTTVLARNATILDVAVSPDASHFAFVQYQRLVVYNAQTLALIGNIELEGFALSCAFSPSGDEVAVGCRDGSLTICDVETGSTEVYKFKGKSVFAVAYSPDGRFVAVSSEANGLSIFDTQKRQTVHTIPHSSAVFGVDFSADGKLLISGSQDRLVRVIGTTDWKILAILSGPESVVTRVAVHPNGQQVVAGSQDDTVRFWSLRSLSAERQSLLTIAEGKTGLAVDDQTLTVIQLANWPMVDGQISSVVKSVRARAELELDKAERAFVYRYEHFRYLESDGQRTYLPPRKRDAFGNYSGKLRGKIDHASWFRSQVDAAPKKWFWRKAFVTEVTDGGQAESLQIAPGDVIWTVNGKWVRSKETLTEAMKADKDKVEMTLQRFERDENGLRIPLLTESGAYILDELGRMQWRHKLIKATFEKGKLGLKVNYDDFLKQPVHRKSKR